MGTDVRFFQQGVGVKEVERRGKMTLSTIWISSWWQWLYFKLYSSDLTSIYLKSKIKGTFSKHVGSSPRRKESGEWKQGLGRGMQWTVVACGDPSRARAAGRAEDLHLLGSAKSQLLAYGCRQSRAAGSFQSCPNPHDHPFRPHAATGTSRPLGGTYTCGQHPGQKPPFWGPTPVLGVTQRPQWTASKLWERSFSFLGAGFRATPEPVCCSGLSSSNIFGLGGLWISLWHKRICSSSEAQTRMVWGQFSGWEWAI